MSRTLWIVGAGREAVPGIRKAKSMGLHVVASDRDENAPGFAYADDHVVMDTYDAAGMAQVARAYMDLHEASVDGVIAMCADVPYTVARTAAAVGAPGLPLDVASLGQDKLAMKQRLRACGVPTAWGREVSSGKEVARMVINQGCEFVVKPVDSRGARGVTRVTLLDGSVRKAEESYRIALQHSPSGRVLAEEWLHGPQVSTEGVLLDSRGVVAVPGFLDRNYAGMSRFAPYVIEDGAEGPSRLTALQHMDVCSVFARAVRAVVGTFPCTVKGDMVLTPNGPRVIELALRLSGGYMSTELVPRMTGVDLVGVAIRLALGEHVPLTDVTPSRHSGVAIRFLIPEGCTSHPERQGHAIAEAVSRDEAVRLAEEMVANGQMEA